MPGHEVWKRSERVFAYLGERRARYASITKSQSGRLLILFTHQTEEQELEGCGDLFLIRRTLDDDWWFYPEKVHSAHAGEPRAIGTMTTLSSGTIIAPFAEVPSDDEIDSSLAVVHMLISEDDGDSWRVTDSAVEGFVWAQPFGRPFEWKGKLAMPLFGAKNIEHLHATRLCCGVAWSTDDGTSWVEYSPIVAADDKGEVSHEFPAVLPLRDGTLLAVTTARNLAEHPELPVDVTQMLLRSYSVDDGASWSQPEQLAVGSWPSLIQIDESTTACTFGVWAAWGHMNVMFSYDGFRTIRDKISYIEYAWIPGYSPAGWGKTWARDPIPLPPVVPCLKGNWEAGHFGFATGIALDGDKLLLVLGHRQKGTSHTDAPAEVDTAIEKERIETIQIDRVPNREGQPAGPSGRHGRPQGQWYLAEKWTTDEWSARVEQPVDSIPRTADGEVDQTRYGIHLLLKSGRWVRVGSRETTERHAGSGRVIGREKGYLVWKSVDGLYYETELGCQYSDDKGKSWQDARMDGPVPLTAGVHPMGQMFEDDDGTLVTTAYGYLDHADMSVSLYVSALVRSHDRGQSWGDWSIVAYDREARYSAYSETVVFPLPDGIWVAFIRTENRSYVPQMGGRTSRSISTDKGKTWSAPEPCATAGLLAGLFLPDGGIAVGGQNTCNWGVTISYDYGRTFSYALPATYFPTKSGVIDEKTFWLADEAGGVVSVYKLDKRTDGKHQA